MRARPTPLTPDTIEALEKLGRALDEAGELGPTLSEALDLLAAIKPGQVARVDGAVADAAGLQRRWPLPDGSSPNLVRDSERLLATPDLEYLFLFHRDGRLREAALLKISGGLPSPFMLAAVLWRLNDWAAPVRAAAMRCARRSFPVTDPEIVAEAAVELLVRQASWGRWRDERAVLDETFSREDVARKLAGLLCRSPTGPQASTLRYALRTPALDQHLERVAAEAVQPSVRAVAYGTLIDGRAEWPSGSEWQWVDKSMGLRRKVPVFARRNLTVVGDRLRLIENGLADRSATVRRVALTGIIRHLPGDPVGYNLAKPLLGDRSPSVCERAEFILSRQG